jgi:hypothetical protein
MCIFLVFCHGSVRSVLRFGLVSCSLVGFLGFLGWKRKAQAKRNVGYVLRRGFEYHKQKQNAVFELPTETVRFPNMVMLAE